LLLYRDKSATNRQQSTQLIGFIAHKRPTLPQIKTMVSRQEIFFQITHRDVYESSWLLVVVAYAPDYNPVLITGL